MNIRDIYALEHFASLEYFGLLRDSFAMCVDAAEKALATYMRHLPADYRNRHISLQPDATWGELVLPNMRWALKGLNEGYTSISHGELDGLGMAGNIRTTFTGISREFTEDWMDDGNKFEFERHWSTASKLAANIEFTVLGQWLRGELTSLRGLPEPTAWPTYKTDLSTQVRTGQPVKKSGVYVPDLDGGCAQFLIAKYKAKRASIPDPPLDPNVMSADTKRFDATWTLIERVSDTGGQPFDEEESTSALRCEAGQPCPKEGWWMTPVQDRSRRHFALSEIMPTLSGDYGSTIWQWDRNQISN